jgi:hypothetical protein
LIGLLLCLAALASTYSVARTRLGHGLGVLFAWGYIYGVARSNFLDGFAHFIFDAAVAGLYLARLRRSLLPTNRPAVRALVTWVTLLVAWPTLLVVLPPDHILINLVGLRVAIFYLPVMLVGAQLTEKDNEGLAGWLVGLNLLALAAAILEVNQGIESLYPRNPTTVLIYSSAVGDSSTHRIPATFCAAAHYGNTMVLTLPFLVSSLLRARSALRTGVLLTGVVSAVAGVFLSSCRTPVVAGVLSFLAYVVLGRGVLSAAKLWLAVPVVAVAIWYTLQHGGSRTQRFMTLQDTQMVTERIEMVNDAGLLQCMLEYPLGNGLAGAVGVTIPYFLQEYASNRPLPGAESEYFRVLLTQGAPGLALWLGFLLWFLSGPWARGRKQRGGGAYFFYSTTLVYFLVATRGVGLLYGLPNNCLLLLGMGYFLRGEGPGACRPSQPVPWCASASAPAENSPARVSPLPIREGAARRYGSGTGGRER